MYEMEGNRKIIQRKIICRKDLLKFISKSRAFAQQRIEFIKVKGKIFHINTLSHHFFQQVKKRIEEKEQLRRMMKDERKNLPS